MRVHDDDVGRNMAYNCRLPLDLSCNVCLNFARERCSMMKFRMKNENGEEFEFEGDEKAFGAVVSQLGGRLFDPARARHDVHSGPARGSEKGSDPLSPRETMTT